MRSPSPKDFSVTKPLVRNTMSLGVISNTDDSVIKLNKRLKVLLTLTLLIVTNKAVSILILNVNKLQNKVNRFRRKHGIDKC